MCGNCLSADLFERAKEVAETYVGRCQGLPQYIDRIVLRRDLLNRLGPASGISVQLTFESGSQTHYFSTHGCSFGSIAVGAALALNMDISD